MNEHNCIYAREVKQNHLFNDVKLYYLILNSSESINTTLSDFTKLNIVKSVDNVSINQDEIIIGQFTPNDLLYSQQLGPSLMKFPEAWEINLGSQNVLIATLDTGIDWWHPDIVDNLYVNSGELNSNSWIDWDNGIIHGDNVDNDGNGFIDDLIGWDFRNNNNNPLPQLQSQDTEHGTIISGLAGARGNNQIGITGMAMNVKIMGLKVEGNWIVNTIEAIDYCITQGVNTISMSYGSSSWGNQTSFHQKIQQAYNDYNILFVGIAHNYSSSTPNYPGAWEEVMAICSLTQLDQKKTSSNFGLWVDVGATCYQHG